MLNYTPHPVVIYAPRTDEKVVTLPSVGVARATSAQRKLGRAVVDGGIAEEGLQGVYGPEVEVYSPPRFTGVEWGKAEPAEGVEVVVSIVAAPAVTLERPDLKVYVPDTGPDSAVRDDTGRIAGVRRLILWHPSEESRYQSWLDSGWRRKLRDLGVVIGKAPKKGWSIIACFGPTTEPEDCCYFGAYPSRESAGVTIQEWADLLARYDWTSDDNAGKEDRPPFERLVVAEANRYPQPEDAVADIQYWDIPPDRQHEAVVTS